MIHLIENDIPTTKLGIYVFFQGFGVTFNSPALLMIHMIQNDIPAPKFRCFMCFSGF